MEIMNLGLIDPKGSTQTNGCCSQFTVATQEVHSAFEDSGRRFSFLGVVGVKLKQQHIPGKGHVPVFPGWPQHRNQHWKFQNTLKRFQN